MGSIRLSAMAANGFASQALVRRAIPSFQSIHRSVNLKIKLSSFRTFHLPTPFTSSALSICHSAQAVKSEGHVLSKGVGDKDTIDHVKRILEMMSFFKSFASGSILVLACGRTMNQTRECALVKDLKNDIYKKQKLGSNYRAANLHNMEPICIFIDKANRATLKREVLHTDFLTPPVLAESMQALEKFGDIKMVAQGGYLQAELCRLSVGHPDILTSDPDIIAAVSISGNFGFEPCSHVDFLGAILGTGIARDKLGDIILQGEKGAHIIVVPELVEFVASSLDKVRNVPVTCQKIPLLALQYQPPSTKSLRTVEASLRLDAIASAGFKISRSKMANLISNGDVRVNWSTVTKNNTTVKTGDIVSVSGKGRLKIEEINSTRKGKFAVELIRFL